MDGWNTTFLLGRPIFRGHVSFREGITHLKNVKISRPRDRIHPPSTLGITLGTPPTVRQDFNAIVRNLIAFTLVLETINDENPCYISCRPLKKSAKKRS